MRCYACGFQKEKKDWNKVRLLSAGMVQPSFIGSTPGEHVGTIDIYVCPNCGLLYTDMRGKTFANG